MRRFVRLWVLLPPLALGLLACDSDCEAPPGTFEPVEGCKVHLEPGEDVFSFCVNRGPDECGGPGSPNAQSWLAGLQAGFPDEAKPTRVGCGPVDPALFPREGANVAADDCCWLMVYPELEQESCVETEF